MADVTQDITEDKEILEQIQNFENSIFRKDLDTGELRCYQHNTRWILKFLNSFSDLAFKK